MDYHRLRYADRMLRLAAAERERQWADLHRLAVAGVEAGRLDEAEAAYKNLLTQNQGNATWWHELALIHSKQQRFEDAAGALLHSLKLDSSVAGRYRDLGTLLEHLGDRGADVRAYVGGLTPGHLRMVEHRIPEAVAEYEADFQQHPDDGVRAGTLASALSLTGEDGRAALLLGHTAFREQRYSSTIRELTIALALGTADADAYAELANALNRMRRFAEAVEISKAGIAIHPSDSRTHRELVWALGETNRPEEAIQTAGMAAARLSSPLFLSAARYLSLPIVYEDVAEISRWRDRFADGLRRLVEDSRLDDPAAPKPALEDLHPNFYLAYQGFNDLQAQRDHGALIHRVMRDRYPQWARERVMPPLGVDGRIRIGYLFSGHTGIDPLFLSWMTGRDTKRFEVIGYQVGGELDPPARLFESACDRFHHLKETLESICPRIIEDDLHVLVYLYVGMGSLWSQLAGLRLAAIQCATWGHPITTGLPTMDYFLSGQLMEPDEADGHYSEVLVRLPGIGTSPEPPFLPPLLKTRADFGLPEDAVLYVSPQSPAKYLPQYDSTFVAIAERVPHALIVLMEPHAPEIGVVLRRRLAQAFAEAGQDSEQFVRFIPNQPYESFLDLLRRCDVFLDTIGWSGGMTTLDAVRCALPVVTCPGAFMRGCQSAGILRQMGVTETIAAGVDDYIEIAVSLGRDRDRRRHLGEQLRQRQDRLFEDRMCVTALEAFYVRVATSAPPPGPG